jgi:hypothetical protein
VCGGRSDALLISPRTVIKEGKMKKEYEGSVYIGTAGSDLEYGICHDSIMNIQLRTGDGPVRFGRATKGYECRQLHINKFMESHHDFALLLDHDMIFPQDALERLRSHKLPFVSGLYMRRRYNPIAPVWFEDHKGGFPMKPYFGTEKGLVKIGASGWGCMLIHRDVITGTRNLLKGECDIIEDDMDVWPYDLSVMMECINGLQNLVLEAPKRSTLMPALKHYADMLRDEFRPLRGVNDVVGSDIRYPFYAKRAGFQLYGDTEVRCDHVLNYPLAPSDFEAQGEEFLGMMRKENNKVIRKARRKIAEGIRKLNGN